VRTHHDVRPISARPCDWRKRAGKERLGDGRAPTDICGDERPTSLGLTPAVIPRQVRHLLAQVLGVSDTSSGV